MARRVTGGITTSAGATTTTGTGAIITTTIAIGAIITMADTAGDHPQTG